MTSLSVVSIVKNEENMLDGCLKSVDWADEIVVLDSGSTDNTVKIANHYTDKVYINTDWQGYGVQRQRAQDKATGDWILMIDADERVTPELQQEIKNAIKLDNRSIAYEISILPWCFGRFIRHGGWYPAPKVRLYPGEKAHYGTERVHEKLCFDEGVQIIRLKGDLLHFTYRDIEHYLIKSARYAAEWAQQSKQTGKRVTLLQGFMHGIGCFVKMYLLRRGFLDGWQGLLLAVLSAHSTFVKYADLWVHQQSDP